MTDKALQTLSDEVDRIHELRWRSSRNARLGASEIGNDCHRNLWLSHRWASPVKKFTGKKIRIFKRGLREEDRLIEDMQSAGLHVSSRDDASGKQYEFEFCDGHAVARLDGVVKDNSGKHTSPNEWHVLEAKSHNQKNFNALLKHGLEKAHPKHYTQVQIEMNLTELPSALYAARCKNDEADHFAIIPYNEAHAKGAIEKATFVTQSEEPPVKISIDPDWFRCRICDDRDVCHGKTLPERNCRTCAHVKVAPAGKWHCSKHARDLSIKEQQEGCPAHRWITQMIDGYPELKDPTLEFVQYKMRDGSIMTDNGL